MLGAHHEPSCSGLRLCDHAPLMAEFFPLPRQGESCSCTRVDEVKLWSHL